MFLSKNLKYLRRHHPSRISQEKLAESIGVTRAAVMAYESGRAEPKLAVLNKIAQYFSISLEKLINTDLEQLGVRQERKGVNPLDDPEVYASTIIGVWLVMTSS